MTETSFDEDFPQIHHPHDVGYKLLLSSRDILMQLLRCFIKQRWVDDIAEDSIQAVDKSFILKDFAEKEADLVYSLKIKDHPVFFYILLELQSSVDFSMPYRLLTYMTCLWNEYLKQFSNPKTALERKDFLLPSVIPIVLYNGSDPWNAPLRFKEMLAGHRLFGETLLNFQYFLLNVTNYSDEDLLKLSNLIGAVFLIEKKSRSAQELLAILRQLTDTLRELPPWHLKLFCRWARYIIVPRLPANQRREAVRQLENTKPEEVHIVISNFARSLDNIRYESMQEGLERGLQRGLQKGLQKGRLKEKQAIALAMCREQVPDASIAKFTGLSLEEIARLKKDAP